jgi:hypothetical protein
MTIDPHTRRDALDATLCGLDAMGYPGGLWVPFATFVVRAVEKVPLLNKHTPALPTVSRIYE